MRHLMFEPMMSRVRHDGRLLASLAIGLVLALGFAPPAAAQSCSLEQITESGEHSVSPTIDAAGSAVVFRSEADLTGDHPGEGAGLFRYDPESGALVRLVTPGSSPLQPALSANGRYLAFAAGNGLLRYDMETTENLQITQFGEGVTEPAISDDGRRIVFRAIADLTGQNADGSWEVFRWDATTGLLQITDAPGGSNLYIGPALSGDATTVLLGDQASGELRFYDASSGALIGASQDVQGPNYPAIAGDGSYAVFSSFVDPTGENPDHSQEIFRYELLSDRFEQLTRGPRLTESRNAALSQNGARIAFSSNANLTGENSAGAEQVFFYDVVPGTLHQVTHFASGTRVLVTRLSGDGSMLVFSGRVDPFGRNADGTHEVFLARCTPAAEPLTVTGERFQVSVTWRAPDDRRGGGVPVQLTPDSGYFWFFSPDNGELVVKVLDACTQFDRFWVFAAGLTDVEVDMVVKDTTSGQERLYHNPLGNPFQPILDTDAFATCPGGSGRGHPRHAAATSPVDLVAKATGGALDLGAGDRFRVEATFQPPAQAVQDATPHRLTSDTGYFWFFDPDNVELFLKVLDACGPFDRFWVFVAGLTDVGVSLRVTDTVSGQVRVYENEPGSVFAPVLDTSAFATCPSARPPATPR